MFVLIYSQLEKVCYRCPNPGAKTALLMLQIHCLERKLPKHTCTFSKTDQIVCESKYIRVMNVQSSRTPLSHRLCRVNYQITQICIEINLHFVTASPVSSGTTRCLLLPQILVQSCGLIISNKGNSVQGEAPILKLQHLPYFII